MKIGKRIISCFLTFAISVTMMSGLLVFKSEAQSYTSIKDKLYDYAYISGITYKNKTYKVNDTMIDDRGGMCYPYAREIFYNLFGYNEWGGVNNEDVINCDLFSSNLCTISYYDYLGIKPFSSIDYNDVLLQAKPGDVIQTYLFKGSWVDGNYYELGHTMIVYNVDYENYKISILDCNRYGRYNSTYPWNYICVNVKETYDYTFDEFKNYYKRFKVHRAKNYEELYPSDFKIDANGVLTGYTGDAGSLDNPLEIPLGVKEIGDRVFADNQSLESVIIRGSVTKIGNGAFSGCKSLKRVEYQFGENQKIGENAFSDCTNLTEIILTNGLSEIGQGAFYNCSSLTEMGITIPESVTRIGPRAFFNCHIKVAEIPKNVNYLDGTEFSSPYLKAIYVSEENPNYKSDECGVLYTKNGNSLIAYPSGRSDNEYKVNAKSIGYFAFYYCPNLCSLVFNDGVSQIQASSITGCPNLKSVSFPKTLTYINFNSSAGLFYECNNLQNIYVDSGNPNFKDINGVVYSKDGKNLICYPQGKSAPLYYNVPNGVESIMLTDSGGNLSSAFGTCRYLKYVILPNGLKSLHFGNCQSLLSVNIPNCITDIPVTAFYACENLQTISIPQNVKTIGRIAFASCYNLKTVYIPKSVTRIGDSAFSQCNSLKNIYYGGSKSDWDNIEGISKADIPSGCKINTDEGSYCQINVACPVDVDIYNSKDELVGRVVNNQVDESVTSVSIFVDEETSKKYITAPGNDTYTVKATGYDSGTMDYSIKIEPMNDDVEAQEYSVEGIIIKPDTEVSTITDTDNGVEITAKTSSEGHGDYIVEYKIDEDNNVEITENDVSHHYSEEWVTDGTSHWHECECGKRIDEHEHDSLVSCSICGYVCPHTDTEDVITYPTATAQGYTTHTCLTCGTEFVDTYTDYVPFTVSSEVNDAYELKLDWTGYDDAVIYEINEQTESGNRFIDSVSEKTYTVIPKSEGEHIYNVTAYFDEKPEIVSNNITVTNPERMVSDIELSVPTKNTYYINEPIDLNGGNITVSYNYGVADTIDIVESMIFSFDNTEAGDVNVDVTYGGITKSFPVTIKKPQMIDMFVCALPKTDYSVGDELDLTGGKIEAWYEYGSPDEYDITADMVTGYDPTIIGEQIITVTYKGFTDSFVVNVFDISVSLDADNYIYDGAPKEPAVTVKNGSIELTASDYTVSYTDNVNAGTATVTVSAKADGDYTFTDVVKTFTIEKATITPTVTIANWVFGATANTPSVTGNPGNGEVTYEYKADSGAYSSDVPKAVGSYTIKAAVAETANYLGGEATATFKITKTLAQVTTAPTALTGLRYTRAAQALVEAGAATGGTMQYSLDGETYSEAIPSGTDAKTYTVYYKVIGDANHSDTEPQSIEAVIAKADAAFTAPTAITGLKYTGSELTLVNAGATSDGTMQYKLGASGTYGTAIPKAAEVDIYTVYYKVIGDANHNDSIEAAVEATIGKGDDVPLSAISRSVGKNTSSISISISSAVPADAGTISGYALNTEVTITGAVTVSGAAVSSEGLVTATLSGGEANDTITIPVRITAHNYDCTISVIVTLNELADPVYTAPTANTLTYNGTTQALLTAGSVTTGGEMQYSADGTSWSTSIPTGTNAGNYTVYYKIESTAEVNGVEPTPVSVSIARKAAVVTADNKTRTENDPDPELTATVTGLVGSDTVNYTLSRAAGDNVGTYTITPSGDAVQGNYTVTYQTGTLTITAGTIAVTGISLNKSSTTLEVGSSETLTATVLPADASDKTVIWSSSDPSVATVSGGTVTAIKAGTTTITATAGSKSVTCTVTVKNSVIAVTGISLNKTSTTLTVGGSEMLTATVTPDNATDKTVTWTTSNRNVAVVVNGYVSATGVGTAIITATAGDKTATCTVTVRSSGGNGNSGNSSSGYTPYYPVYPSSSGSTATSTPLVATTSNNEPTIEGSNGISGWTNIIGAVEDAKDGDIVTVDMNGVSVVPEKLISTIAGTDVDLVLDMGDGIKWTINGKDVTGDVGDIDLSVTVGTSEIPTEIVNDITGEHYSTVISLAHNGDFGFTATLTINMRKQDAGLYANLFYYNKQIEELEFVSSGVIREDGSVDLEFTHASDYTIVVDDHPLGGRDVTAKTNGNKVKLKWNAIPDADKYVVYYKKNGKYKKLTTVSNTALTVTGLKNGKEYEFLIRYSVDGMFSEIAESYTISVTAYFKPVAKLTAGKGYIRIMWDKVEGATAYRVYKYVNGKLQRLVQTEECVPVRLTNTQNGKEYVFAVRALVNGEWTTVYPSELARITAM